MNNDKAGVPSVTVVALCCAVGEMEHSFVFLEGGLNRELEEFFVLICSSGAK